MQRKGYAVVAIALLLAGLLPAVGLVAPPQPIMEPVEEVHSFGYTTTAAHPAAANITRLQISPSHKHVRLQPGEEEEFTVNVRPQVVIPPYGELFAEEDWITVTPSSAELPAKGKRNGAENLEEEWTAKDYSTSQKPSEEEKGSHLTENEKLKKAFALGASILIPLGCSAPGLSGKYNFNAKAVLEDAVKFLKKALPVDNHDFGVIGVAKAQAFWQPKDPKVWYNIGKEGHFILEDLDPSLGPPDEKCWQAYKKGWYDGAVEKGLDISYEDFEKFFPQYAIMSLWMKRGYPPKNINNYQPKLFLELSNPNEEVRKIAKPNTAPYWKWVYGWWPEGPQEENRDFHFIDDPLNAFISADCLGKCALLSTDDDPYPELLASQYGPGANVFSICIPTFKQIDEHTYQIFPAGSHKWKCFEVKYDALDKEKKYPELYEILEKNGFKYIKEVDVPKDILPEIVFDVQKPPESLIIEKAEKPEPSPEMPTSEGLVVPTITSEQMPSPTPESNAGETPGFGIGEVLASLAAAGIATLKIRKKK